MAINLPFDEGELAFMLCTRLCHDIAGPISAVGNGLEFYNDVAEDAEMRTQAMDLMSMSSKESQAKLQMARIAFGRTDSASESAIAEFQDLVSKYFAHGRILLQWNEDDTASGWINNEVKRLIAGMILAVSDVMAYGGRMSISFTDNYKDITVTGENNKLKTDTDISAILNSDNSESLVQLSPYNVPVWILHVIARKMGVSMDFSLNTKGVCGVVEIHTSFV